MLSPAVHHDNISKSDENLPPSPQEDIINLVDHFATAITQDSSQNSTQPTVQGAEDDPISDYDKELLLDMSFLPDSEIDWDLISSLESSGLLQTPSPPNNADNTITTCTPYPPLMSSPSLQVQQKHNQHHLHIPNRRKTLRNVYIIPACGIRVNLKVRFRKP